MDGANLREEYLLIHWRHWAAGTAGGGSGGANVVHERGRGADRDPAL